MPGGLLTDLYELNMAVSYLRRGMTGPATFSLFVRDLPPDRGFLIAAGLEDCLAFLEEFSFTADDLAWLADTQGFRDQDLAALRELRFTGQVWAVPEGTAVFAGEPLVEVTAPAAEAQLAETVLLNHVTVQTSIATKAARCVLAARGAQLVDFSFRRTQGIEAGLAAARASAIAGFTATSNTEAARRYGLPAAGTMAHSFIEAFGSEKSAYKLTEFGARPVMKLSEGKATLPGAKQVHRGPGGDLLALRDEPAPPGYQSLLVPVMRHGARLQPPEPLATAQQRCAHNLAWLPSPACRLRSPTPVPVTISPTLSALRQELASQLRPPGATPVAPS